MPLLQLQPGTKLYIDESIFSSARYITSSVACYRTNYNNEQPSSGAGRVAHRSAGARVL